MFQLTVDSTSVLGRAFWAAIVGNASAEASSSSSSSFTMEGACPISEGGTLFYFDTSSTTTADDPCRGLDWYILAYLTVIVHAVSWGQRWLVWEPGARVIAKAMDHASFDRETCRKVSMNLTECFFFVTSGVFAFLLFAQEWWLYQPEVWMKGRDQMLVPAATKFYYLLYMARFVSDFISLFFEVGRTPVTLLVSCIHHVVTLGLIAVAIAGNYVRAAAVIMFFFDWADPPLLLAKTCKYMSVHPTDAFQTAANRLFEVFAVTFFLSRNVIYNYVTFQFLKYLDARRDVWEHVFLLSLAALQTYWLALIVQAVVRQSANNGNVEDVREENGHNGKKKQQ